MKLDLRDKPIARAAFDLAERAHDGQTRKYTGERYFEHPIAVAQTVIRYGITDQKVIAAALLHDTLEDAALEPHVIKEMCGPVVLRWVQLLSDLEKGNRETRKALSRDRLSRAPSQVQAIKLADMIDNTKSIVEHDPKFAAVYLEEKKALIDVLTEGKRIYPRLWDAARAGYTNGLNQLAQRELSMALAHKAWVEQDDAEIADLLQEQELMEMRELAIF